METIEVFVAFIGGPAHRKSAMVRMPSGNPLGLVVPVGIPTIDLHPTHHYVVGTGGYQELLARGKPPHPNLGLAAHWVARDAGPLATPANGRTMVDVALDQPPTTEQLE